MPDVLVAGAPGSSLVTGAQILTNDHSGTIEMRMQFTCDNAGGTAALNTFYPIPGCGSAARATLPSGVTYTAGSFTTYADAVDYLKNANVVITQMRLADASTTNYTNEVAVADVPPFNTSYRERILQLSSYRESVGNGYSDVMILRDMKLAVLPQTYMRTAIKKNTVIDIYFTCAMVGVTAFVEVK